MFVNLTTLLLHNKLYRDVLRDINRMSVYYSRSLSGYQWSINFFPMSEKDPQIQAITCGTCGEYKITASKGCDRIICQCSMIECEICIKKFLRECDEDQVKCENCNGQICGGCQNKNYRCFYCGDYYCNLCYLHLILEGGKSCHLCFKFLCKTCLDQECECFKMKEGEIINTIQNQNEEDDYDEEEEQWRMENLPELEEWVTYPLPAEEA